MFQILVVSCRRACHTLVHAGTGRRVKELVAYDAFLRRRWSRGCANAAQLFQELRSQGYRGAATTVRQYL